MVLDTQVANDRRPTPEATVGGALPVMHRVEGLLTLAYMTKDHDCNESN